MTVAGDVGSGKGTEPMTRYGQNILKRKKPYKKQEKKMKSFREMIKESPVGMVGRTKDSEAMEHIEISNLAKKFRKIVRELGGKTVARQLLAGMTPSGNKATENDSEIVEKRNYDALLQGPGAYLRKLGYKIKNEEYNKYDFSFEFYNEKDCKNAYEDLVEAGFTEDYLLSSVGKFIEFEVL
jgi:hypothetical protein